MMRAILLSQIMLVLLTCTCVHAEDDDVVIKALVDEAERTAKSLRTGTHSSPYFVSFSVKEINEVKISSCLGAEADMSRSRTRMILPVVRIGDHKLDSSLPTTSNPYPVQSIPVDDDYSAIRRVAWLAADRAYTHAIRTLEWKKAYLSRVSVPDRPADLTVEVPVVSIQSIKQPAFDERRWRSTLEQLSAKFKQYPSIQKSKVSFNARVVTNWIVNNEGTKVRQSKPFYSVRFYASMQADDGMKISDYDAVVAADASRLPSDTELDKRIERFASNLVEMQRAPLAEAYCGPVLFKGQAAAKFISDLLAPNFGLTEEFLAKRSKWRNPLKNAIGRRILPEYITIIDDPKIKQFGEASLIGGYDFDDDGMPAQRITLVEKGILKDTCRSRVPTRTSSRSNGHSQGGLGVYNTLQISSDKTLSEDEMKEHMVSLAKDAGLDYVLVLEKLEDSLRLEENPDTHDTTRSYDTPAYSLRPETPVIAYRMHLDGRKEFLRGLEFNSVSLRSFRDIQGVGSDAAPHLVEPPDYYARQLITPSILIGELDLRVKNPEHLALPVVPAPLTQQ